jgi:predicted DNA-binding transcriptional regulator YafY
MLTATLRDPFERENPRMDEAPARESSGRGATACSIRLDAEVRWAADVHGMVIVREYPDGGVEATMPVYDPGWVVRLVLALRGHAELLAPGELRAAIASAARQGLLALDAHDQR